MTTTAERLEADLSEIALNLVQAYCLKFEPTDDAPEDKALHRWMDYRLRCIAPQPREVHKSSAFPVKNLPAEIENALSIIELRFQSGKDVNPYISTTTVNNDVNSEDLTNRTDGLLADWGIHHLHLTTTPLKSKKRFAKRSGWLLFFRVYEDAVAFIDVRRHDEKDIWTQVDLVKTFISSWPEQAEPYRINRTKISGQTVSSEDHKLLRSHGINSPIEHNGHHYFGPGRGVTAAVTSVAATMECDKVVLNSREIANWLDQSDNPIRKELKERGIPEASFNFSVGDYGLGIAASDLPQHIWTLPDVETSGKISCFGIIQHGLMPKWSIPTLMKFLRSKL